MDLSNGDWTNKVFKNSILLEKDCYKKIVDRVFVSNSSKEGFDNLLESCNKLSKDGFKYELWTLR